MPPPSSFSFSLFLMFSLHPLTPPQAAQTQSQLVVEVLLGQNANALAKDAKGRTALHFACARNDMGTIENFLLKDGTA